MSIILIRKENMIRQKYKYNTKQFQLGMLYEEKETVRSPYSKLRDMVLGQNDFTKKQKDILQISARYTREPDVSGKNENEYWRYCIESNVPLLPVFFVSLAKAFLETNNYKEKLDERVLKFSNTKSRKKVDLSPWKKITKLVLNTKNKVNIAIIGKYVELKDAYKSLDEALTHGGIDNNLKVNLLRFESDYLKPSDLA